MRHVKFLILFVFVAIVAASTGTAAAAQCAVAMVDGSYFPSGSTVTVTAITTGTTCPASIQFDEKSSDYMFNPFVVAVEQRIGGGGWERIKTVASRLPFSIRQRQTVAQLTLPDGKYRVLLLSGTEAGPWFYQDALHFVVGTGSVDPTEPYFQPAAVWMPNGTLYFKGFLAGSKQTGVADGFLYQVQADRTVVMPVQFRQVDPQDRSVNWAFRTSSPVDNPWISVQVDRSAGFETGRPIFASVTVDGGGTTIQGQVFDPANPSRNY